MQYSRGPTRKRQCNGNRNGSWAWRTAWWAWCPAWRAGGLLAASLRLDAVQLAMYTARSSSWMSPFHGQVHQGQGQGLRQGAPLPRVGPRLRGRMRERAVRSSGEGAEFLTRQRLPASRALPSLHCGGGAGVWWLCFSGALAFGSSFRPLQQVRSGALGTENNPSRRTSSPVTLAIFLGIPGVHGRRCPVEGGSH